MAKARVIDQLDPHMTLPFRHLSSQRLGLIADDEGNIPHPTGGEDTEMAGKQAAAAEIKKNLRWRIHPEPPTLSGSQDKDPARGRTDGQFGHPLSGGWECVAAACRHHSPCYRNVHPANQHPLR